MTIHFHIIYHTQPGEKLVLEFLNANAKKTETELTTSDGQHWQTRVEFSNDCVGITLNYRYILQNERGDVLRREAEKQHTLTPNHEDELHVVDSWLDTQFEPALLTTAFSKCVFAESRQSITSATKSKISVRAVEPPKDYEWALCGSSTHLGKWNPKQAAGLKRCGAHEWMLELTDEDLQTEAEYKFVLRHTINNEYLWENGDNRKLIATGGRTWVRHQNPRLDLKGWRGAGVVIPVFSLRSAGSQGIGDFGDLEEMAIWAASCGMHALQILPVNDTTSTFTWHDSYPYSAISVFALHPLYLDLREWADSESYKAHKAEFSAINSEPALDYDAVVRKKMAVLHELYREIGETVCNSQEFRDFVAISNYWLQPYVAFCLLRDEYHTTDTSQWDEFANYDEEKVNNLLCSSIETRKAADFYRFAQFLCHCQLKRVQTTARQHGVILKGDIPIGVSAGSADAWALPELFHFNGQAGAPPDAFAKYGQNWGFPTYNWEAMERNGYAWWRLRMQNMGNYFDAYRIDHVLGFFRIWEIPSSQRHGLLGRFRPALPYSVADIQAAGFKADISSLATPQISVSDAENTFSAQELSSYFERHGEAYRLSAQYADQQAIAAHAPAELIDRLMNVCDEVLFIADSENSSRFHPRIAGHDTARYAQLSAHDREVFDRLHNEYFYFRHNEFWAAEAYKKLGALINNYEGSMLPCAEDLGMIPASVKGVLANLHLLSLEIQRMPKEYGWRFAQTEHYPYLSVATISTHDMSPLRLWWKEDREQTNAFWHEVLHGGGNAPDEATAEICEQVVNQHLESPSMLCLLALQDWFSIDPDLRSPNIESEQINIPANPNHYWRYRMHVNIEQLQSATPFNEKIRSLIARAGR